MVTIIENTAHRPKYRERNSKTFEDSMEEERKKKAALIDKFIETNPKIAFKPGSAPARNLNSIFRIIRT